MCTTDKPFKACLYKPVCIFVVYMWEDQTPQFHPVRRVGRGFPWFCWDAAFMWKQSLGPFSPSVVTEDNEFHNICHLLALFGVTDLLLIRRLPTRVQLRSWNEADGSHGLSGAAAGRTELLHPALPLLRPWAQSTEALTAFSGSHCLLIMKPLCEFKFVHLLYSSQNRSSDRVC